MEDLLSQHISVYVRGIDRGGEGRWANRSDLSHNPAELASPASRWTYVSSLCGALDGESTCCLQILRNANVACLAAYLHLCDISILKNKKNVTIFLKILLHINNLMSNFKVALLDIRVMCHLCLSWGGVKAKVPAKQRCQLSIYLKHC